MRRALVLIGLLGIAAVGCAGSEGSDHPVRPLSQLEIRTDAGPVLLHVEVARTPANRAVGLMGRVSLPKDQGMVFLFRSAVRDTFCMKDTLIPLSIAFWDEERRIVAILDMEPCETDPCPTYGPDEPYVGAVEVNRGFFEEHGVVQGDRVELEVQAYQ